MKILVINAGSSSIKYQLFDMRHERLLAKGLIEKIGESESQYEHTVIGKRALPCFKNSAIPDHRQGFEHMMQCLLHAEYGVLKKPSEIVAVGHRVVHGGDCFNQAAIIDAEVLSQIREFNALAPLHNPANLQGVEIATAMFKNAIQVAVFDTAFHQTMPPCAYHYAIPNAIFEQYKLRRYGFHGTSHQYVANEAAKWLGEPIDKLRLITLHLGNGASMAAIDYGVSIDTSMGFTPLEGLVMGTRSGDIDPSVYGFLKNQKHLSVQEIETILNKRSGLLGLCGYNDMRDILKAYHQGDRLAELALEVYCYRIQKYIGAYYVALGGVDALVFTGGVGEHACEIRARIVKALSCLDIILDDHKNNLIIGDGGDIHHYNSKVKILIIPTNEELAIARETVAIVDRIINETVL